jgi:two-component system sensor histidine kinase VanS
LNNKDLQKYRIRYLSKTILIILGTLSFFTLLFYIFDVVFSGFIANILIGTNQAWADWMMDKKVSIMLGIMLLAIISAWLFSTIQTAKTLNLIVNSIDIVFNKDKSLISLPQDLRDVEQKLNSIKYEAIRNEQLAKAAEQRKNDLIVYLAHDLKTPLTSVLGYLVLLTDEKDISKDLEERYLNIALKKAQRLEELINEFFDIARFNLQNIHLEKSTIDVSVMLTQLQEELYPLYKTKSLKCKIAADSGLTIIADGDKLARVFSNLLKNAIAYSYENC